MRLPSGIGRFIRPISASYEYLLPAIALVFFLSACASNEADRSGKSQLGPGDLVRTVELESGAAPNSHPVRFDARTLRNALTSIYNNTDPQTSQVPLGIADMEDPFFRQVFTEKDMQHASVALARAFSSATPGQDIALRLSQLRKNNKVFALGHNSHTTAARLFYRNDKLHVIMGAVDVRPLKRSFAQSGRKNPKASSYSLDDEARYYRDEIGSRSGRTSSEWTPVLPDGIRVHQTGRSDWLEIDMAAFSMMTHRLTESAPALETRSVVKQAADSQMENTEQRLQELLELRDKGLISETLYEEKTRELVDSLLDQSDN